MCKGKSQRRNIKMLASMQKNIQIYRYYPTNTNQNKVVVVSEE